jgi:hypothetical protein
MLRFTTVTDIAIRDEDVLLGQLTRVRDHTGVDALPDLIDTIRRVTRGDTPDEGVLYLTHDLQGVVYWSADEPTEWPLGIVIARWTIIAEHGTEVDRLGD